jgi:hypothetical protein
MYSTSKYVVLPKVWQSLRGASTFLVPEPFLVSALFLVPEPFLALFGARAFSSVSTFRCQSLSGANTFLLEKESAQSSWRKVAREWSSLGPVVSRPFF